MPLRKGQHVRKHPRHSVHGRVFHAGQKVPSHVTIGVGKRKPTKSMIWGDLHHYGIDLPPEQDHDSDGIINVIDTKPLDPHHSKIAGLNIACGNAKLHKTIGIFSIPARETCPGSTPLCRKYCYAYKGEQMYSGFWGSNRRNLYYSKQADFVHKVMAHVKKKRFKWFRVHESGDFYSQDYLEKWFVIARECPECKFLAFTKNWRLDFSRKPQNFSIRYSTDDSSEHRRDDLPQTYVGANNGRSFFECACNHEPKTHGCTPVTGKDGKKVFVDTCMQCWSQTDVFIKVH